MFRYILVTLKFLYKIYWMFIYCIWYFFKYKPVASIKNTSYSIGIITYINRYDSFFVSIIEKIAITFPDTEIIVGINGYYDKDLQIAYLDKMSILLKKYNNVISFSYLEGQSLSKLWNQLIIHSSHENIFIFNDDIKIAPFFRWSLEKSDILKSKIHLINKSWSHFLISKSIIKQIGWFDERLPGVGNEDEDYEARLAIEGINIFTTRLWSLKNEIFETTDFSYGKNVEITTKYIKANQVFFNSKWELSKEQKKGFTWVRILNQYARLKEGMETPNFYKFK